VTTEAIVVALIAVLIGAAVKSISGMGFPLIAIPITSFATDLETAVALIAVPNLAMNLTMVWRSRSHIRETRDLPTLGITGIVGGVIGTFALVAWPEEPLVIILLLVVVVYVIAFFRAPTFKVAPATSARWSPVVGSAAGLLQGAIGMSGPLVGSWVHSYRLSRDAHILSITLLFALAGGAQLATLVIGGQLSGLWVVAAIACVPALATIRFGEILRQRFSSQGFDHFVVAMIVVTTLVLAFRTFV